MTFGSSLQFDKTARLVHHHVHVGFGFGILGIVQIQHRLTPVNAH